MIETQALKSYSSCHGVLFTPASQIPALYLAETHAEHTFIEEGEKKVKDGEGQLGGKEDACFRDTPEQ